MNAPNVYIEITPGSLHLLAGTEGLDVPLTRLESGRLDPVSCVKLTASVRELLKKQGAQPGLRAFCAIGARGVSLRRLTLPTASKEELERLLVLQIEREFPLPPDELAWGCRALSQEQRPGSGSTGTQELLVVAVKKEALQEYAELLTGCGLTPLFTLAAWARNSLVAQPPASYAVLDIGRSQSELISFENSVPGSLRALPWGDEKFTGEAGLQTLADFLRGHSLGQRLYVTGAVAGFKGAVSRLGQAIGRSVECELIETASGEGRSAAILGLKKSCEEEGEPPLILKLVTTSGAEIVARPAPWKWAALACLLLFASVSLRYAEAIIQQPRLARKISGLKIYRDKLPNVDRELGFLQYLKTNQPPYLDSLFVLANAAPPGSRIETLSMNRRGDLALRASMKDSQQVVEFRSKLISSGAFSAVTVDEQTPTPDKQKVVVRITGQWKSSTDRKSSAGALPNPELEKLTSAVKKPKATGAEATGTSAPPATISTSAPPGKPRE